MNTTPAGHEPHRPTEDGTLAPTAPGTTPQPLTKTQKILTGVVVGAVLVIATLGFIGSYTAVTHLATQKGFGNFADAFPIAVDAGIIAFLALDLLLTWRRIPYPLLRYTAWGLTAATIAFNAVVAWPDPIGTGMHGVIPVLFVIAVEAARHAIGRIAEIVADKHIEGPPVSRWLLNPAGTFILWRRQRLWSIRKWDTILELERERRIYCGKLRQQHGRGWRRKATAEQLLVLRLARDGMSVTEAIALPAREEEKRRQEQDRIAREKQENEDKRHRQKEQYEEEKRRKDDEYKREQQRIEDERLRKLEDARLEQERKDLELAREREATERQRLIEEARTQAELAEIERQQRQADEEDERRQRREQLEHARLIADEQQRAAAAAKARQDAEEIARLEAERKLAASRRAAEILRTASASQAPASHTANASTTRASASVQAASPVANTTANTRSEPASPAAASTPSASASPAATTTTATNANASQTAATSASGIDIDQVVTVYQLLEEQEGKAPSDAKLGQALGVSRSRAQQLRTAAIDAGHTELAKPMRLAS